MVGFLWKFIHIYLQPFQTFLYLFRENLVPFPVPSSSGLVAEVIFTASRSWDLIQFSIDFTDKNAEQPTQEGEDNTGEAAEDTPEGAVVGEAVVVAGTSGENVDLLGGVGANEDVEDKKGGRRGGGGAG